MYLDTKLLYTKPDDSQMRKPKEKDKQENETQQGKIRAEVAKEKCGIRHKFFFSNGAAW